MNTQRYVNKKQSTLRVVFAMVAVVVMVATAGVLAAMSPQKARAASVAALSCATGDLYSVGSGGSVYKVTASGTAVNTSLTQTTISFSPQHSGTINGLAIGSNGNTAFAFERTSNAVSIKRWDASTNQVQSSNQITLTKPSTLNFSTSSLIAGGINPADSGGYYYFGGFATSSSGTNNFILWRANPSTFAVNLVGYIVLPSSIPGGNGDLAFDQSGNLYVLSSSGNENHIIGVNTTALLAANGGSIAYNAAPSINRSGSSYKYNGMAFSNDGKVYVQGQSDNSGSATYVGVTDPSQGGAPTQTYRVRYGNTDIDGVDLASCQTPPTIQALKKNVVSRYNASDQFTLSITPLGNSEASAIATTSGTATGLQAQVAGPVVATPGSTYVLEESAAGSAQADLSKYVSTLSCVDTNNGGSAIAVSPVNGSSTKYTITIPNNTVAAVSCTFTNEAVQKLWNFYLQKYGPTQSSGTASNALDGATFQILSDNNNQPGGVLATFGPTAVSGQTGKFAVSNIPEGSYWLKESNAPAGYDGLASPVQFKVGADGSVSLIGNSSQVSVVKDQTGKVFTINVADPQKPGVELPNTGGDGTAAYLGIGLVLMLGCIGVVAVTRRMGAAQ